MTDSRLTAVITEGECLSITIDGETTILPADAINYNELVWLLRNGASHEEIKAVLTPAVAVESYAKKGGFEIRIKKTGMEMVGVFYNGELVHTKLADMILNHYINGFDIGPLRNFFLKAISNKSADGVDVLFDFINANKLPITEDGDVLAFKATRPDGFDKHTGTVQYRIGDYLHVTDYDPNEYTQCGSGLHFGGRNYVSSYGNSGVDKFFLVKVNPADIIYYRADGSDGKMRCRKLFVYAEVFGGAALHDFVSFAVVNSPEGDLLEREAGLGAISEVSVGASSKVATQAPVETEEVIEAKKEQTFVTKSKGETKFVTKDGKSVSAKQLLKGVQEKGQRGFSAATGIARTTIQGWLDALNAR
jgi:hypothetical protein